MPHWATGGAYKISRIMAREGQKGSLDGFSQYERKLVMFINELKNEVLNDEQTEFYNAFENDTEVKIVQISDLMRLFSKLKIHHNTYSYGSKHIIIKHFKTNESYVTAKEIVQMGEIIRTVVPVVDPKNSKKRIYKKTIGDIEYSVVVNVNFRNKVGTLITFYTNRKTKKQP